jgi:hypothetical protein
VPTTRSGNQEGRGPNKLTQCTDALANLPKADGMLLLDAHPGNTVNSMRSLNPAVAPAKCARLRESAHVLGLVLYCGGAEADVPRIRHLEIRAIRMKTWVRRSVADCCSSLGTRSSIDQHSPICAGHIRKPPLWGAGERADADRALLVFRSFAPMH